ncbi:MAG: hypothetical protein ACOY90_21255 [Candidatus Zhuqueibacterota bacterium]
MNRITFTRYPGNPIIPRTPGTFFSIFSANPDLLIFNDMYYLYFRGQAEAGHDQIGVACTRPGNFDGIHWKFAPENPILRVGADADDFDSGHILDPATIVWNGQVYLYYSAHNINWKTRNAPSGIGLAVSTDGIRFGKHLQNPVVYGTAPEAIVFQNRVHLFFQRRCAAGYFEIHHCPSDDGMTFSERDARIVFRPSAIPGAFDEYSISTVRIWPEGDWFYMVYGGCDRFYDYPIAFGLARSRDLLDWERYPGNPIFARGEAGTWDEGAVWFATMYNHRGKYLLWYEGAGCGIDSSTEQGKRASQECRDQDYGGYGKTSFSQIGLAFFEGSLAW